MRWLVVVAEETPVEPDPSLVTPGLLGLGMVLFLGFAVYLLVKSMNRQLAKVDLPDDPRPEANASDSVTDDAPRSS